MNWPWPPSYSAYLKTNGLTPKGRKYRQKLEAMYRLGGWRAHSVEPKHGALVLVDLYPPDFRLTSIGEYLKAPINELCYLGILDSARQIEALVARKRTVCPKKPMLELAVIRL